MTPIQKISIFIVLPGILFLLASVIMSMRTHKNVPDLLRGRWLVMTYLIFFFLIGYVAYLVIQLAELKFPLELVTSTVFLGGSIFVFLVITLTQVTIRKVKEGEQQVSDANEELRRNNIELKQEVTARRQAEEQAKNRLQHLSTLHSIDMVITSSLDLKVTMKLFLEQVIPQLGVDAAVVLLFDSHTQFLEYGVGCGFRATGIQKSHERLGEGSAGVSALERRVVHIPKLAEAENEFVRAPLIEDENFVSYYAVPLVAKGQVKGVLEIFHSNYFEPEQEWLEFLDALAVQAAIAIDSATLFNDLQTSNTELILAYDTTIEGWSKALELRDQETEGHTQRVTDMTMKVARKLGISEDEMVHVRRGALLHDIGKMAIPDSILMKPGPFTEEEQEVMQKHPKYAFEMLSPIAYLRPALDIPYCHHEKWDGTGYPRGLKGEQIPLAARIFALADTWDALISERRYHEAWSREKVFEHFQSRADSHFDPQLVDIFLELNREETV